MKKQTNGRGSAKSTSTKSKASGRKSDSTAKTTTEHEEIRQWAEARNGVPACVKKTGGRGDAGILRIDFPGGEEASLQEISWDEWFNKFDESDLAFLYQEKTASGRESRFNKLVSRETAKASASGSKTRSAGQ